MTADPTWYVQRRTDMSVAGDPLAPPSGMIPLNVLTGHPYLEHAALLAIYNAAGSNVDLHVTGAYAQPILTSAAALSAVELRRITACSGGASLTPISMDTSATALPAQVTAQLIPQTVTGTTRLRRIVPMPRFNLTRVEMGRRARLPGSSRRAFNNAEAAMWGIYESAAQATVLREGEGFSVYLNSPAPSGAFEILVWFRVQGGATWMVRTETPLCVAGQSAFALFNGSGSGVIIDVLRVEICEKSVDSLPLISLELIDGMISDTGTAVVPVPMDTANSLSGSVLVRSGCVVYLAGSERGAIMVGPGPRRSILTVYGAALAVNGGLCAWDGVDRWCKLFSSPRSSGTLVLHQGEGLALLNRGGDSFGVIEVGMTFATVAVAGGSTAATHGYSA